ncbi:MAG: RNA polymerase Rpb6, partial [Muribaculum sp.]|nr:RNA polymerase Rpb6 [Candidatus Merdivivens faecigallinarum]
ETFENREQIEISKYYEKLPKPTLVATQEFIENDLVVRKAVERNEECSEE